MTASAAWYGTFVMSRPSPAGPRTVIRRSLPRYSDASVHDALVLLPTITDAIDRARLIATIVEARGGAVAAETASHHTTG